MAHPSPATTLATSGRDLPCSPAAATRAPLAQRLRQALGRWWLRQCQQAERKTRVVPRY